jgi:hypothetical protein
MAPFGMAMHPHGPGLNAHSGRVHVNYADYVMGSMPALIGGGAMGLGPPQPHVVQGGMGEPKRHSAGKGGDSPTGKKARTAGEVGPSNTSFSDRIVTHVKSALTYHKTITPRHLLPLTPLLFMWSQRNQQAQSGGGNVEVKLEPVDPFTAMKPTLMER